MTMVIKTEIYVARIKELMKNFSYYDFISLLKELDKEIINGDIYHINPEFVYYFGQIISMVNDKYIVDGKNGTLEHMLIKNAFLNKEKLTSTLAMCFFLEQKANLGLDSICNEFKFTSLQRGTHIMITHYHDTNHADITINWESYTDPKKSADEQAHVFMLQLAQTHPEYFNDDLIEEKKKEYQFRKTDASYNYGNNPRETYAKLISDMKKINERYLNEPSLGRVKKVFERIEEFNEKSEPLITELQKQGISEKGQDSYYNIYLKSLYRFDGQNIVLNDAGQKEINTK